MASASPTQPSVQQPGIRYSQYSHPTHSIREEHAPITPQHTHLSHEQPLPANPHQRQTHHLQPHYVQPLYALHQPTPFIAELPAPLPVAPDTSTPRQQLDEDEQLARKLVQLEAQEIRNRPNSNVNEPEHLGELGPHLSPALSHRSSSQAQGVDSRRLSSGVPFNAESYGPPPAGTVADGSELPEVVVPGTLSGTEASQLPEVVPGSLPAAAEAVLGPSSLSAYLEKYRQVPYPPQWKLAPPVVTLYASTNTSSKADWLDTPDSCMWHTIRRSEVSQHSPPPLYMFSFKTRGGTFRDPKHSWTMTCNSPDESAKKKTSKSRLPSWEYELRLDRDTGIRKHEALSAGGKRAILTTYVQASNYDSLRFVGNDGKAYQWVSQVPLGYAKGARYDTLRHALFVARGSIVDPLYGDIVADHAFWDGSASGRPEEALCIRSAGVQCALVVASLQVLKDWHRRTLRKYREKDPEGFMQAECIAREQELGMLSHWRGSDKATR
jgi:hypothetical protein